MRTFIAVEPPDKLRKEIGHLSAALGEELLSGMRWVNPNNMHLTLRFLGEIDPGRLEELEKVVGKAAHAVPHFGLEVDLLGYFGPERSPRVIWLGLKECGGLGNLAASVEKGLISANFGRADKPFKAHLTLARLKGPLSRPPDWEKIRGGLPSSWPAWPVGEVRIIESTLTPSGPEYKTLAHCPLKPESAVEIGGDG